MASDFRREYTGGETGVSKDGSTASAVWTVTGLTSTSAVLKDADIPVRYNDPYPDDPGSTLRCDNLRATTISPGFYRLTASFSIPQSGGGSHTGPSTNPLTAPAEIRWEPVPMSVPFERDVDGNTVISSSTRGFDPPDYREVLAYELTISRNEPSYNIAVSLLYGNTVNVNQWSGAPAGDVRCISILPTTAYTSQSSYINIAYKFLFLSSAIFGNDPHQARILDQDTMAVGSSSIFSGSGNEALVRLVTTTGDPVDGPVLFNGSGRPVDGSITYLYAGKPRENPSFKSATPPGATPEQSPTGAVFLRYKKYATRNFSALGLPV